jgi:hypothetical protein
MNGKYRDIAFYLLLAYAASMTLPLVFSSTSTGLDPSWYFATNYFAFSDYKYGPDIVFTEGPLGFVYWPEDVGWNLPVAFAFRLLIWILLIREMAVAYRRSRAAPLPCFLVVLSILVAQPMIGYLYDELLACAALLMIVRDRPEAQKFWHLTFWLSILMAIAFLAKETGYLMLMPAFTAYFLLAYFARRSKPSRASLLRFGWIAAAPFIAYLVYNPSVTGLWAYFTSASSIVSGYSAAMSLPSSGDYLGIEVFAILMLGFAAYGWWRKWLGIESIACVTIGLFVTVKHTIVRQGPLFFYGFGLVLFAILVLQCRRVKAATIAGGGIWMVLCVLSLIGMTTVPKTLSVARWNPVPHLKQIGTLLHWRESMAAAAAQTEANLFADTLPDSVLRRIQRTPVVIFPWELSYGPANHLNLVPLYTLQSYCAYTNRLDRATAQNLARTPRDTRLLLEWKSIDGRHPLLDVPATWEAIYNGFEGELAAPGLLLLKKREHPAAFNSKIVERTISDVHQWRNVPDREHAVTASVSFSPTLLGMARGFLYKSDPVYMEVETDRSELMRFRVIPDVLRYPFVINCLPLSQSGLESLVFGHMCEQKVKRFRFSGDGVNSFSAAEVALAETPDAPLRFAAENFIELESGAEDVRFGNRFVLRRARLTPGGLMELLWQSLADQPLKYTVFVHLMDQSGKVTGQADHVQVPQAQTTSPAAKAGETWRDVVRLPGNGLKGVTRIGLGIYEPAGTFLKPDRGGRDWDNRRLLLPVPKELSGPLQPSPAPSEPNSPSAKFGDELSLADYSIGKKNGHTEVGLRWNVLRKPSADYYVFVHALDGAGAMVFQGDHPLKNAAGAQTRAWTAGDIVEDRFLLAPPANRPPGSYTLRIGVADAKAGRFLRAVATKLPEATDGWKGRAILLENVPCK